MTSNTGQKWTQNLNRRHGKEHQLQGKRNRRQ